MTWRCEQLSFTYPSADRPAVAAVSLDVPQGACTALLGPNGSGKSTLLRLMLGVLPPGSGSVTFQGRSVADWPRAELARQVGVIAQSEEIQFPLTVRELVSMGRYPHLGRWRSEGAADRRAIDHAMRLCDVHDLRDRPFETLSGGERQRARIARALAQEPRVLAVDEPTIALDVRHEMEIFELLRDLGSAGVTVLLITHNLNLAARYAGRLVLLDRGCVAAQGTPCDVFRRELLERVYRWPVEVTEHPGPGPDRGAPQIIPLAGQPGRAELVTQQGEAR
jgi:iron complex transport system ATP-binding protein